MLQITINPDLSIESDHTLSNTETQYIDLLKYILKDNFNKFTLITDDCPDDSEHTSGNIICLSKNKTNIMLKRSSDYI